jgi:hypothetical protein
MLLIDCRPTRAYWMAFDLVYALTANYKCLSDSNAINAVAGVCAVLSDLYAVALPCIITWHHAVPARQRIALNAIFALGFVVVAAGGVRTYWLIGECQQPYIALACTNRHNRDQHFTRPHQISVHALRLGPIRAPSWYHVCVCTSPSSLLPPLPRHHPRFIQQQRFARHHTDKVHHRRPRYNHQIR